MVTIPRLRSILAAALLAVAATAGAAPEPAFVRTRVPLAVLHPMLAHRDLDLVVGAIRVYYPAERAEALKTAPAWTKDWNEAGVAVQAPLRLALWPGLPPLTLACDSGPSADPSCRLLRDAADPDSALLTAAGTDFVFDEDGSIYSYGHADTMYDEHRLFRCDGKAFVEVPQRLRYVGVENKARAAIALTATREGGPAVAQIAAGTKLAVLLHAADSDDYLLLTRDGLTGWAHLPRHEDGSTDVEGLYYRGD